MQQTSESLQNLIRLAQEAMEFKVPLDRKDGTQVVAVLRLLTRHQARLLTLACDTASRAFMKQFERAALEQAVVGWLGLKVSDLLAEEVMVAQGMSAEARAAPVPFEPGGVPLFLDAQPEWADELGAALMVKLAERRAEQDSAAKN